MKNFLFLVSWLFLISSVNAQEKKNVVPDNKIQLFKSFPKTNIPNPFFKTPESQTPYFVLPYGGRLNDLAINNVPKAEFLYHTESGSVYALPLDNMPCLRPMILSEMPVRKSGSDGYIPNPLRNVTNVQIIPIPNR